MGAIEIGQSDAFWTWPQFSVGQALVRVNEKANSSFLLIGPT